MANEFEDLTALVARVQAGQAALKASQDATKADIAKIIAGLPATGGLTADQTAQLKAQLSLLADAEEANAAEEKDNETALSGATTAPPTTTQP